MLEYIEQYNYSRPPQYNVDDELTELAEGLKEGYNDYQLYDNIRGFIYREIKIKELAVTRILEDLLFIHSRNAKSFQIICYFIVNNYASYRDISEYFNVSKQNVYQVINHYANQYLWLKTLIEIKGQQDKHNQNNRQIFFEHKKSKYFEDKKDKNMFLFEDDLEDF